VKLVRLIIGQKYLISYWRILNNNNHEILNLKYKCINRENIEKLIL
jgi:hypothetical protein